MNIRNLKVANRVFLAPMEDVNDIAFRELCKKAGAGLCYTGMIHPLNPQKVYLWDKPAIQIFSNSEKGIKAFIEKHDQEAVLWDFNLGCPADMAKKTGIGAYLQDLEAIEKIMAEMRSSTKKPISVKIRKSKLALKIVKLAEKYCDAICLHPRTLDQGYSGVADVRWAERIKEKCKIPIIYSGDVDENNAKELLKKFDYVMIGRKAIGNPGVFARILGKEQELYDSYGFKEYLDLAVKYHLKFSHIRKQAVWFMKNDYGVKKKRIEIMKAKNIDELIVILG